ncbi:MAG: DUF1847 domain-containing protein [Anaerolineae bacterium]|nr:DUF1847 domain-containing protein [Anaerolineae bacterium]
MELRCAVCGVQACCEEPGTKDFPDFCPAARGEAALREARAAYEDKEVQKLALAAARTEADRYPLETRVEEVMSFARRIGASRLGIASCVGLIREARILQEILQLNEFEVASVCCKVGTIPKEEIGLVDAEKIHPGQFEVLCNPIAQAKLLNAAETQLNVVVGLCVGHDSLFFRHSEAPVTVLVAKDRVTGHNPAAVLYTSHSYYRRLREK